MKKAMDLKDFTYLLLATLANNPKIINSNDRSIRTVCLPSSYKETIEKIMCQNNGWKEEFSCLIDIEEYFYNNYKWEDKFARCLKDSLKELNKSIEYDLVHDNIYIEFKQCEIDDILTRYEDEEINSAMEHFSSLLNDYVFTREYKAMLKNLKQTEEKYKSGFKPIKR